MTDNSYVNKLYIISMNIYFLNAKNFYFYQTFTRKNGKIFVTLNDTFNIDEIKTAWKRLFYIF